MSIKYVNHSELSLDFWDFHWCKLSPEVPALSLFLVPLCCQGLVWEKQGIKYLIEASISFPY